MAMCRQPFETVLDGSTFIIFRSQLSFFLVIDEKSVSSINKTVIPKFGGAPPTKKRKVSNENVKFPLNLLLPVKKPGPENILLGNISEPYSILPVKKSVPDVINLCQ